MSLRDDMNRGEGHDHGVCGRRKERRLGERRWRGRRGEEVKEGRGEEEKERRGRRGGEEIRGGD